MELLKASSARRLLRLRPPGNWHRNWVCPTCQPWHAAGRRLESTAASSVKPFYVTTPIFYVNAAPHIGHMYSMVLADVLKRWQILKGRPALLCTGTDEHGSKVQRAAASQSMNPKEFCDSTSLTFRDLAQKAGMDNDFFIRTTDEDHVEAVKYFWTMLKERGFIYESQHSGFYCVSDECFYPESTIEWRQDAFSGKVIMASKETGNEVEFIEEKNYHFRMTALRDRLLEFYEKNPEWVRPATRMSEVVDWVKNNLEDLSISRPVQRLSWGIPVPDDPSQVVYVWVDALINYITKAGYPNWAPGSETSGGWPADVHVIGKDIVRFHCVYWPALLLALDLPLPKAVLSHAHWTINQKKMSKSIGNVVNPLFAIERFGLDATRFYLIFEGGIANDSDYSNEGAKEVYKKRLQFGLGNLASRVLKGKGWRPRECVEYCRTHGIQEPDGEISKACLKQLALIDGLPIKVSVEMEQAVNPRNALRYIMDAVAETNKFLAETKPWTMCTGEDKAPVNQTIYAVVESLRVCAILLLPFIPEKAGELLDKLGVADNRRMFEYAKIHADPDYGTSNSTLLRSHHAGLFPPLPVED